MPCTRRAFLSLAAKTTALALAAPLSGIATAGAATPARNDWKASLPLPGSEGLFGLLKPDARLVLSAGSVPGLLPATGAAMLAYSARLGGRSYHNPVLVLDKGQELRCRLQNALNEPTIIHWHGLDADWRQAGHPLYAVGPGQTYDYAFPITNRAGAYWYHPHPHGLTARQSYLGLASFVLVRDDEEQALARELDLTLGVTDLPVALQDKRFDAHGGLVYAPSREDLVMGHLGSEVLANGARRPTLRAATRIYRLRLLNGCTARLFNLSVLRRGRRQSFLLVGNDGGLLDVPRELDQVFLAPGERVELLIDLRGRKLGEELFLANEPFDPMHNEGGHAGHGAAPPAAANAGHGGGHGGHGPAPAAKPLEEGVAYPILRLLVERAEPYDRTVPSRLSSLPAPSGPAATDPPRRLDLALDRHAGRWTIAGQTFDMDARPVVVERRRPEAWVFVGAADGMPHPMHLHGYFFRVDGRQGSPEQVRSQAVDARGRLATDLGLKDTVLVWPGEAVAVTPDFGRPDYPGPQTFLLHCHNLEHEDQGMMLNVLVK